MSDSADAVRAVPQAVDAAAATAAPPEQTEYLILGAGLTGLAAGHLLAHDAIVLEAEAQPGGLVRTECIDGYWFDRVLHLLYFADQDTETRIRGLLGQDLAPCPPEAWVESLSGTVRYPYQVHLGGLPRDTVVRCLHDLARVSFDGGADAARPRPAHFEELLVRCFGRGMCDDFLLPYNRKMWKRPLCELAPAGFTWNIDLPDFEQVLRGALEPARTYRAYNAGAWYPRPPAGAPVRGMEVLARALAATVPDLRCGHRVQRLDLERRQVHVRAAGQRRVFGYRQGCLSTLPLPRAIELSDPVPPDLRRACAALRWNRVVMVMMQLRGPRPAGRGHWRYYADEGVVFNRLIHMHAFDPLTAPPAGWGLMAEVTEPSEAPVTPAADMAARACQDARRVGAIPEDCEVLDAHVRLVDPAYVVFEAQGEEVVEAARAHLRARGVTALGRYGRWEYSSMAQVLRDGFGWAREAAGVGAPV